MQKHKHATGVPAAAVGFCLGPSGDATVPPTATYMYVPRMHAWSKHTKNANTSGYFPRSVSCSSPSTDMVVFLMTLSNIESKNPLHALATDAAPATKMSSCDAIVLCQLHPVMNGDGFNNALRVGITVAEGRVIIVCIETSV